MKDYINNFIKCNKKITEKNSSIDSDRLHKHNKGLFLQI